MSCVINRRIDLIMSVYAYVNGCVYVSFNPLKRVEGFIVSNGRVIYTGSSEDVLKIAEKVKADIVDLEGKTVLPGFIDSHIHIDALGKSLKSLDLRNIRSIKELKNRLSKFYRENPKVRWIFGRGWDQELFEEKRWPNRWDIDEVVSDKPVLLIRVCGHAAVVNTKALELTGYIDNPPKSDNYVRDGRGELTGIILEDAVAYFNSLIRYDDEEMVELLKNSLRYIASNGVTTVGFMSCGLRMFKILERLRRKGALPVRIRCYFRHEDIDKIIELGIGLGFGDDYLKIMGVKLFSDGSLGARTAWLSRAYYDDPETRGFPLYDEESLFRVVKKASDAGLQVAIHAIGDKAIDMVISIYSKLDREVKRYRHRIEHLSVVRKGQIDRLRELDVSVSIQPHFVISDWWGVNRVGIERAKNLYPFKTLIDKGVKIGLSTDSPVESLNPWETIYAAVTRGKYEGIELYEYTIDEKISVKEALYAYTKGSAYIMHDEGLIGSLEDGKAADFIIVDRDPLNTPERDINKIKVIATYVNGEKIFDRDNPNYMS